jgi:Viral BACON domain
MSHNQDPKFQRIRTRTSSSVTRVFSKRATWFSIAICLLLLLTAAIGLTQKNAGVHAAQATHAISSPKHAPSKPHPHVPPKVSPTMSVSPSTLSFTMSLSQPHTPTQTQTFTLKNNGDRLLRWYNSPTDPLAAWVASSLPAKGTVAPRLSTVVTVTVKPTQTAAGTYTTHLVLIGTDQQFTPIASSPQTITITLTVTP